MPSFPFFCLLSGAALVGQNAGHPVHEFAGRPVHELDRARRDWRDDPAVVGHARPALALHGVEGAIAPQLAGDQPAFVGPAPVDDSIPLPQARTFAAAADGDQLLAPASGDPFVLRFIPGDYAPPRGERLDPELAAQVNPFPTDGRPDAVVYAFAMFGKRITDERVAELEALGARVLGFHPHYCLKLAVPADKVSDVAALDFVHWLGAPKRFQKLHPAVVAARDGVDAAALADVFVSVYDSDLGPSSVEEVVATPVEFDAGSVFQPTAKSASTASRTRSNGWQQRALEALGVEVEEYVDSVRTFRVRVAPKRLDELAALDFVQFVEPVFPRDPFHDDSTPMVGSDVVRASYDGNTNHVAIAGIVDSGVYLAHDDLDHAFAAGWQFGGTGGAFHDPCGHGTHVAGTILGDGDVEPKYTGNAPDLGFGTSGRFFVVKVSDACADWSFDYSAVLSALHTAYDDGSGHVTPAPHVINNSWGKSPTDDDGNYTGAFVGSELECRMIDAEVFDQHQMHVFAAGNDGGLASNGTIGLQATAKNAFTVGSVDTSWTPGVDLPGELSYFSSHGPTADSRAKPNLVAPGESIHSASATSATGYLGMSGTSMAAPHVTGVVADLIDQYSWLQYNPHRLASLLMANAVPHEMQTLWVPLEPHRTTYGAGKLQAELASFGSADHGWTNWGAWIPANNYGYADFTVNPGCTRLTVCMVYNEAAASAGAAAALINDLDLYIDRPPIDPSFSTGEYLSHTSTHDNVELRTIENPIAGTWRWKVWPSSAPQGVHCSVTVAAYYGDLTPPVTFTLTTPKDYFTPAEPIDIDLVAYSPSSVATSIVLEPSLGWVDSVVKTLGDGVVASQGAGWNKSALLGDLVVGATRSARYRLVGTGEGAFSLDATLRGENVSNAYASRTIVVDGTPPNDITDLHGVNVSPSVWTNEPWPVVAWSTPFDALSGVAGFAVNVAAGAPIDPGTSASWTTNSVGWSASNSWNGNGIWVSVRAIDRSGNPGNVATSGPYFFDLLAPEAIAGLGSTTHVAGSTTCSTSVSMTWDAGVDGLSGVAGYAVLWNDDPNGDPGTTITNADASDTSVLGGSLGVPLWFHVRAMDVAGNGGPVAHWGPLTIDAGGAFTNFCASGVTGLGCVPTIYASGCPSLAAGNLHVLATGVDGNVMARLLVSGEPKIGSSGGGLPHYGVSPRGTVLCLGTPTAGPLVYSQGTAGQCNGGVDTALDAGLLASAGLGAGDTVYAQYLVVDPTAPAGVRHSDALTFTLQP